MSEGRGNRFARHPRKTLAVIALLGVVSVDLVAGRLFIPKRDTSFRRPHPYYHHDLIPNMDATSTWVPGEEFPLHTNSLGFKDRAVRDIPLRTSKRRIVFIGDSFTEGVGVPYRQTFVGRLEDALAPDGVEVLNAGVIGYSPKIYYLKTRYLVEVVGLEFDELFVLIDFSDVPNEIIYEHFVPHEGRRIGDVLFAWHKRLMKVSYFWYAIGGWLAREAELEELNLHGIPFTTEEEDAPLSDPAMRNDGYWDESYKYAAPGFRLARENMQKLVDLCRRHGIAMTIVVYPWPTNIVRRETDHVNLRVWRDFARANDGRFVNLFPRFVNDLDPLEVYRRYFIPGDVHWNAAGHAVVAEALLSVIER
jgi:lysophospholipase L1-like esterase